MKSLTRGHLKAGLDSLRTTKVRNFWTMLGIIIGVASVITVLAIGEGVKQQISGQIKHIGKDVIIIRPDQLRPGNGDRNAKPGVVSGLNISGSLSAQDTTVVKTSKGVGPVAPLAIVTGDVKAEERSYNQGFVFGTTADLPSLLNQSVAYGSFFSEDDAGLRVAILGATAADQMFDRKVPLGSTFTIRGQEFMVRGIFNEFSKTPLNREADFNKAIFIPEDVAATLTNDTAPTYEILAKPDNPDQVDSVTATIQRNLDRSQGGKSNAVVKQGDQNLSDSDSILNLLTLMIAGVASISLLVGGIGIMNVMLVSVAERMHEIGIRKAVGATNRQILSQFLVEATILSLVGGVIGVIIAYLLKIVLQLTTSLQPIITWEMVALSTSVTLLIGVVFGSVPAIKAARRHPIDALRSE